MGILQDGTSLTTTNLQNAVNDVRDRLNDVEEHDVRKWAFRKAHLPNLHNASGSGLFDSYWAGYARNVSWDGAYANQLHEPGVESWNGATPLDLQTFLPQATSGAGGAVGPYGPINAPLGPGWRILADDGYLARAAEIGTPSAFDFDTEKLSGVWIRGQVELGKTSDSASSLEGMAIAVGWEDGAGTRHVLERSFRPYQKYAFSMSTLGTGAFLTQADLDTGDGNVAKIFMVIAQYVSGSADPLADAATGSDANNIGSYNISILPFHAEAL